MPEATVLVTGGCGFIGSHLVTLLRNERPDWRVVVIDNLTYAGNPDNLGDLYGDPRFEFVRADVADAATIAHVFEAERPQLGGECGGERRGFASLDHA